MFCSWSHTWQLVRGSLIHSLGHSEVFECAIVSDFFGALGTLGDEQAFSGLACVLVDSSEPENYLASEL